MKGHGERGIKITADLRGRKKMKITSFNPLVVTKDPEPVIQFFEAIGFERRHQKKAISDQKKRTKYTLVLLLLAFMIVIKATEVFAQDDDLFYLEDIDDLFYLEDIDDLFYLEDISDSIDWNSEEETVPSTEKHSVSPTQEDLVSSTEADPVSSSEDNLKALHQYNQSIVQKIKVLAENYPEDSEVRAIYERYAQILSEPLPGRPTEEESRLYSEEKLSKISDQLKQPAVDYYKTCVDNEPQITSDLYDIAEELGTEMFGIQYRLKSAGENEDGVCRIADKISQYMSEGEMTGNPISYEEAAHQVRDIIRYTQAGTPETLTQNYLRTKEHLEAKGYKLVRVRNSWKTFTKNAPYRGVNTVFVSPDGIMFELQFHTAESLVTKEAEHPLYEICRNPNTTEEEKEALSEERYQMYVGMTEPDNIEEIG